MKTPILTRLSTDKFLVTGILTNGKKFRIETDNFYYANGINLYNGRVWLIRDGKKILIKRVIN